MVKKQVLLDWVSLSEAYNRILSTYIYIPQYAENALLGAIRNGQIEVRGIPDSGGILPQKIATEIIQSCKIIDVRECTIKLADIQRYDIWPDFRYVQIDWNALTAYLIKYCDISPKFIGGKEASPSIEQLKEWWKKLVCQHPDKALSEKDCIKAANEHFVPLGYSHVMREPIRMLRRDQSITPESWQTYKRGKKPKTHK